MRFLAKPTPHTEAAKLIAGAPAVDRATFDAMLPEFQHGAFLITGIAAHDALQDIQDLLGATQAGEDFEAVRQRVELAMEPFLGGQARRRSLMVVRAWAFRATSVGVTRQLDNHRAAFPFRKRLSAGDGRVRDSHLAMHGMVLPADSPFWSAHTPPDEHNCRCMVVGVTRAQAARLAAQEEADVRAGVMLPEERRLATGAVADAQGRGVINRGPALQWDLNKEAARVAWDPRSLLMPMDVIKSRYTPDVWDAFQQWAQGVKPDGKTTLWDKLNAQRPATAAAPRAIQQALPLPAVLPRPRTREEVRAALKLPEPGASSSSTPAARPARPAKVAPPRAAGPVPAVAPVPVTVTVAPPRPPRAAKPKAGKPVSATEQMRERIRTAAYTSRKAIGARGINGSYRLANGVKVVFKPREEESRNTHRAGIPSGSQHKREVAASLVAEALSVELVPPVAMLPHGGQTGSAMLQMDGYRTAMDAAAAYGRGMAAKVRRRDLEAWQLFDDVVNHLDRHKANWMVKERMDGSLEVALIDNGLCLPETHAVQNWGTAGKRVPVGLEGAPLSAASQAALRRFLAGEAALRSDLAGLLEPGAVDLLFDRARRIESRGSYGDAV